MKELTFEELKAQLHLAGKRMEGDLYRPRGYKGGHFYISDLGLTAHAICVVLDRFDAMEAELALLRHRHGVSPP